jgi:hypothetical protein
MHVIRHDDEGVGFHSVEMVRYRLPACLYYLTHRAELHETFRDFAEQAFALVCAQGNKVCAGLGVVVTTQAYGMAVVRVHVPVHPL